MRVEDLRAAHAAALTRDRLRVAIVGAIGPEEAGPMLDRLFGGLPETVGGVSLDRPCRAFPAKRP